MRLRTLLLIIVFATMGCKADTEKKLRDACHEGDPGACDVLSARYAYGDGVPRDPERADEFERAARQLCADGGTDHACKRHVASALPIDLPKAAMGVDVPLMLHVSLAANGATSVNGAAVPNDEAIYPVARDAYKATPDLRALVAADQAVPYSRVVHAVDQLRQAGIAKIAFSVSLGRPAPSGAEAPPGVPPPTPFGRAPQPRKTVDTSVKF